MRVLLLGTYPVDVPLHGGQRRTRAIITTYQEAGVRCRYLAVYPKHMYRDEPAGRHVFRASYRRLGWFRPIRFAEDVYSGLLPKYDDASYRWFRSEVLDFAPTHVHLEQPYMYPAVERLAEDLRANWAIIYSSQNVEAPLKSHIWRREKQDERYIDTLTKFVDDLERELADIADLVICASRDEEQHYLTLGAQEVLVCRNGASPSQTVTLGSRAGRTATYPYLLTVGSFHPPNGDGFAELLLNPGLFFLPLQPSLVVAGGMSLLLEEDKRFMAYRSSNLRRARLQGIVSEAELSRLRADAHGFLLPIRHGGGTNLKTAEAILSGKWVVATPAAMRGFDDFLDEPGIVIEDEPKSFRRAVRDVLAAPELELGDATRRRRREVEWRRTLAPLRRWVTERVSSGRVI